MIEIYARDNPPCAYCIAAVNLCEAKGLEYKKLVLDKDYSFEDFSKEFNVIYPALAKEYDLALYPFFMDGVVGRPDLFLPDGIHPTADGIDIIVGKITPQVVDALDKAPA